MRVTLERIRRRCLPLVLASVAAMSGAAAQTVLEVTASDGLRLFELPLAEGQRWCLVWNHSVAGFAVRDCFAWRSPHLMLQSSHQPDFAAGLGHFEGRGRLTAASGGGYLIDGIDEALPENRLVVRVGSAAVDHRIEIDLVTISLSEKLAGERVTIRAVDRTHSQ